jgi:hypothetical protein
MLPYKISLTYGDPSHNGHGMHDVDYYQSSHTTDQIRKAVKAAEKLHKFSFKEDICTSYEECTLTQEQAALFETMGITVSDYVEPDPDWRFVHDFTGLYLAIARTQLPDLVTEFIEDNPDNIYIGGYGVFSN